MYCTLQDTQRSVTAPLLLAAGLCLALVTASSAPAVPLPDAAGAQLKQSCKQPLQSLCFDIAVRAMHLYLQATFDAYLAEKHVCGRSGAG